MANDGQSLPPPPSADAATAFDADSGVSSLSSSSRSSCSVTEAFLPPCPAAGSHPLLPPLPTSGSTEGDGGAGGAGAATAAYHEGCGGVGSSSRAAPPLDFAAETAGSGVAVNPPLRDGSLVSSPQSSPEESVAVQRREECLQSLVSAAPASPSSSSAAASVGGVHAAAAAERRRSLHGRRRHPSDACPSDAAVPARAAAATGTQSHARSYAHGSEGGAGGGPQPAHTSPQPGNRSGGSDDEAAVGLPLPPPPQPARYAASSAEVGGTGDVSVSAGASAGAADDSVGAVSSPTQASQQQQPAQPQSLAAVVATYFAYLGSGGGGYQVDPPQRGGAGSNDERDGNGDYTELQGDGQGDAGGDAVRPTPPRERALSVAGIYRALHVGRGAVAAASDGNDGSQPMVGIPLVVASDAVPVGHEVTGDVVRGQRLLDSDDEALNERTYNALREHLVHLALATRRRIVLDMFLAITLMPFHLKGAVPPLLLLPLMACHGTAVCIPAYVIPHVAFFPIMVALRIVTMLQADPLTPPLAIFHCSAICVHFYTHVFVCRYLYHMRLA
eukprot:Rhum_TRINITY_DN21156_c0_g1::Rhum_TRINITY_DN21156_c0_g1_i1::g.173331::m.173331